MAVTVIMCVAGSAGIASITQPGFQGHRSSLRAKITTVKGSTRTVILQGVGCATSICSRVAVRDINTNAIWLEGLSSISDISRDTAAGSVKAVFRFKNGTKRQTAVIASNRVFYIKGDFGRTEKLDLASLAKIDLLD